METRPQEVWHYTDLAPEGQKDVVMFFDANLNLAVLNWTPPGGTETITTPLKR